MNDYLPLLGVIIGALSASIPGMISYRLKKRMLKLEHLKTGKEELRSLRKELQISIPNDKNMDIAVIDRIVNKIKLIELNGEYFADAFLEKIQTLLSDISNLLYQMRLAQEGENEDLKVHLETFNSSYAPRIKEYDNEINQVVSKEIKKIHQKINKLL